MVFQKGSCVVKGFCFKQDCWVFCRCLVNCELSGFDGKEELSSSSLLVLLFLPFLLVSCPLCLGFVPSLVSFPFLSFFLLLSLFPFCSFSSLFGCPFFVLPCLPCLCLHVSPLQWTSQELPFRECTAFMERSRSPRRSSSSGSCRAWRVTLPVQHSALALSPSPSWHPTEGGSGRSNTTTSTSYLNLEQTWTHNFVWTTLKPNMEFYDYQKINGLRFPRLIQPSIWSQSLNIAGQDPLTLPLSKVLQGGKENFWLRILASGKEIHLAPTGEVLSLWMRSSLSSAIVAWIWLNWLRAGQFMMASPSVIPGHFNTLQDFWQINYKLGFQILNIKPKNEPR